MYLSPPDHLKCPGFGLGLTAIFFPKCPFFGVAVIGNETPGLVSETRKRPGISRVKKFYKKLDEEEQEVIDISDTSPEKANTPSIKAKVNPEKISH